MAKRKDIYRQAIKRAFADVYGVSPATADVSWTTGKTIVAQCAAKTFLHPILSADNDALELAADFPFRAALVHSAAWNRTEHAMRKVLRGYAKTKDGNLILIGTMPVPHSKDKSSPRERLDKRHLVRQGATIFKKETVG